MTRKHGPARYAYAIKRCSTSYRLYPRVEATPDRFSAEVAAARTSITRAKAKLGIAPVQLAADKAYGNGPLLGWLIDQGIMPHVPVIDRTRQRDDFFTRDAFRYDCNANVYHCPNDKLLTYRGTVHQVRSALIAAVPPTAPRAAQAAVHR